MKTGVILSAMVTRFLDFARPLHADLAPKAIPEILDRALRDVAQLWKGAKVRIEKNYQANLPPVPLDETLAEQAFVNIIQNAYDAMGTNGVELSVKAHGARQSIRNAEAVDGVEVRIADTGPGIPAELREQIFNPFVTTKKTGVGLGLSIVSKIVDGHHGSIRVESSSNGSGPTGTCFVMFFPAVDEKDAASANAHLVIS